MSKRKVTTRLPDPVVESLKNAAYWLRKPIEQIVAEAVEAQLAALQDEHNGGKPFQKAAA